MKSDRYYRIGVGLIMAAIVVVTAIAFLGWLLDRGTSLVAAMGLVALAALVCTGICHLLFGILFDGFSWLEQRVRKWLFKKQQQRVVGTLKTETNDVPAVLADTKTMLNSLETDSLSDHDRKILNSAIQTVCDYFDRVLGDAIDDINRNNLCCRLRSLANMEPIPDDVPQVRVDRDKVTCVDLCHYGWNIWYALKCARNQFYDQAQLIEWLKASFDLLARYDKKTLRAKLRATDGVAYHSRIEENLKEYLQQ